MRVYDIAVIGGGIAGLAAAWELRQRGLVPVVLERSDRAGGVIVTERHDGFVLDGGPDSLLVQKPAAIELCAELGIADRLVPTLPPRTAYVLRDRRLVPLPEASFLGLPTHVAPLLRSQLFSWQAKARMATEVVRAKGSLPDESIGSFIRRRFGDEAADYLAEPLLAGIHAGDVDQLSVHALFPRLVALEQTHGSVLRGLRANATGERPAQGAFASFPRGIAELPEALAAALGPEIIQYDTAVEQISGAAPYKLTLQTDAAIYARSVIVATPAWAAARLLRSVDSAVARLCDEIPYSSTATVAFAFTRGHVAHALNGTGFVVPRRGRQALMAGTWVSSKWPHRAPPDRVLLRGFVGGATQPQALVQDDQTLAANVLAELKPLLGITGDPIFTRVFRWPRSTPQYIVGHLARVQALDDRLARLPGVYLTGSGYRGTGIPDCIADARATAARAAQFLRTTSV
jgi:oxygen-dependent protoporphyrinogen oxidase